MDKYIEVFNRSIAADIIAAEVDTERLRNTDIRLTEEFPGALHEDILLTHFRFTEDSKYHHNWKMRYILSELQKIT